MLSCFQNKQTLRLLLPGQAGSGTWVSGLRSVCGKGLQADLGGGVGYESLATYMHARSPGFLSHGSADRLGPSPLAHAG